MSPMAPLTSFGHASRPFPPPPRPPILAVLSSLVRPGYFLGFYFWLDAVATCRWVRDGMGRGGVGLPCDNDNGGPGLGG